MMLSLANKFNLHNTLDLPCNNNKKSVRHFVVRQQSSLQSSLRSSLVSLSVDLLNIVHGHLLFMGTLHLELTVSFVLLFDRFALVCTSSMIGSWFHRENVYLYAIKIGVISSYNHRKWNTVCKSITKFQSSNLLI